MSGNQILSNEDEKELTDDRVEVVAKTDYAIGMRTMRLVNNQIYDAEEFKREDDEDDEMEEGGEKVDKKKDGQQ